MCVKHLACAEHVLGILEMEVIIINSLYSSSYIYKKKT